MTPTAARFENLWRALEGRSGPAPELADELRELHG